MTVCCIFHHPIKYIKNCWVRLLSNYNIKYICTTYTRLDTCLMSISRIFLRDKVTLRLLKLYFYIADVAEWSRALDIRLKRLVLQCINGMSSNPVEGRTKFVSSYISIFFFCKIISRSFYIILAKSSKSLCMLLLFGL